MRKPLFFFAIILTISLHGHCQVRNIFDWVTLIRANKCDEASRLCLAFVDSQSTTERAEAQKCFSNVVLCGHDIIQPKSDDAGGRTMGYGFEPAAVDEALKHLNLGIQLAPQDLSIHQGRLHLLEVAARYNDMVNALDESCDIYKGENAVDAWLAYSSELMKLRQYHTGLALTKVLEKHYPNNPDILGNIGAYLSLLEQDSEAISYLKKAVELAPNDPINTWDLAKTYDYAGQILLADTWYQKALSLDMNLEQRKQSSCLYAVFIETKLHDRARACPMEKKNCEEDKQTACTAPSEADKSVK